MPESPYRFGVAMLWRDGRALYGIKLDANGCLDPYPQEGPTTWTLRPGDKIVLVKPGDDAETPQEPEGFTLGMDDPERREAAARGLLGRIRVERLRIGDQVCAIEGGPVGRVVKAAGGPDVADWHRWARVRYSFGVASYKHNESMILMAQAACSDARPCQPPCARCPRSHLG